MNLHDVHPARIRVIHEGQTLGPGPVVYWMNRDGRIDDNWALLFAQNIAITHKRPLHVVYNLELEFLGGGARSGEFKLQGLHELARRAKGLNIDTTVVSAKSSEGELLKYFQKIKPASIVTDFCPLRISRQWQEYILENYVGDRDLAFVEVDAHNIIPVRHVSGRAEFAARTIRPKIHRLLSEFLIEIPEPHIHPHGAAQEPMVGERLGQPTVGVPTPGHEAAMKAAIDFIQNRLSAYATGRNDPNQDAQSGLSPYFHFGHISTQRAALMLLEHLGLSVEALLSREDNETPQREGAAVFLEEMIIRRELSDNFCLHHPSNYDNPGCMPQWAQKTHIEHQGDERDYLYSRQQWEAAETHDELWNAAQRQMLKTGKMHGYMRMYWAKKILEWSEGLAEAWSTAIYLNDRHSLDGRDPNGYAGIAWSLGGLHDRAWFDRPVFGKIRYMNANGCRRKFDVDSYIEKWNGQEGLF